MIQPDNFQIPAVQKTSGSGCIACGSRLPNRNRRYCSRSCQEMMYRLLNRHTGLLRALNVRYATFHFSDNLVIMDILPNGAKNLFSFMLPRKTAQKPVKTFEQLAYMLGSAWWNERNRTNKHYLASRHVLDQANQVNELGNQDHPIAAMIPSVRKNSLITLNLKSTDLANGDLMNQIKSAYRRQVKKHHPDLGGDSVTFRKIHEAYESMLEWADNPRFTYKKGFPDKWFYDGRMNRWKEPT